MWSSWAGAPGEPTKGDPGTGLPPGHDGEDPSLVKVTCVFSYGPAGSTQSSVIAWSAPLASKNGTGAGAPAAQAPVGRVPDWRIVFASSSPFASARARTM